MNFTILIVCCLWSKIAYLLASREKNNENIERTLKTSVCAYYTGIFYLINIIVGSEKVERTEHVKNFWNVIVIVVDFFITLTFSTIERKVMTLMFWKFLTKTLLKIWKLKQCFFYYAIFLFWVPKVGDVMLI